MAAPPQKNDEMPNSSEPLVARIAEFARRHRLLAEGETVLVAVSGGSDSLAMLHLLQAIAVPVRLIAAYIDHRLRPTESPAEQQLVNRTCRQLGVDFITTAVDVPRLLSQEKRSPEEAARFLRYQALEELRRKHLASAIAVGHTADDQVEEFFLRLLRGASRKGFCGMAPRSGTLIRPLLEERKAVLIDYLAAQGLSWCFDSSNDHRHFLRNRVRLDLLPALERDFSPGLGETVRRTMEIFASEEDLLSDLAETALNQCRVENQPGYADTPTLVLDCPACRRQHPALLRRIVESCFWEMGSRPSFRQIEIVRNFLTQGQAGGVLHLEGGLRAELRHDQLRFIRLPRPAHGRAVSTPPVIDLTIPGPGDYPLPALGRELRLGLLPRGEDSPGDGLRLDAATVPFPLQLRAVRPGERFSPCHGNGSKKINRFLGERKIAASQRFAWPVLVAGDRVIALPGLEISHPCRVTEETTTVLTLQWRPLPSTEGKGTPDDRETSY